MTDELPVHVSRTELHAIEVPPTVEVEGSFDVRLQNHGESLHIHLHLDDDLSEVAAIDAGNHYVEGGSERRVRVEVDPSQLAEDGIFGQLKIASAYGAETRWVDVEVSPPETTGDPVEVDESLAKPQPRDVDPSPRFEHSEILVLALGAVALLVAALTALLVQNIVILAGSILVLGGVLVALYFLLQA